MKTPISLIYEAFKSSGRTGFKDWMIENEQFLKELEKECIIKAHIAGMEFIAVDPKHYVDDANEYYNSEYKGGNHE